MSEGRDLRNKVCFVEGNAYAMGGLNSKADKLNFIERKWNSIACYPLSDNLDSWASCLLFTPKLFSNIDPASCKVGTSSESKEKFSKSLKNFTKSNLEELSSDILYDKEKVFDDEMKEEMDKVKMTSELAQTLSKLESCNTLE